MIAVGLNLGDTQYSKPLKDGGICIIKNGKIISATAEERITKRKYAGGFGNSLSACFAFLNLDIQDVDLVVASSCCENRRSLSSIKELYNLIPDKFRYINHHYSHALSSFMVSPFKEALIIISDGGGNLIQEDTPLWWTAKREQSSYFIGMGRSVNLIERDFEEPYEAGIGEVYRYFTHHLGWRSSEAGKVMALAALGDPNRFKNQKIFDFDPNTGQLSSRIHNDPLNNDTLTSFLLNSGYGVIPARRRDEEISQLYMDLARHVQDEISDALIRKISFLVNTTGIKNICLAGGVSLNCVTNERILQETPIENIFIQPAAGDQGQSIGNAIYGSLLLGDWEREFNYFNPYLGIIHDWDDEVMDIIRKTGEKRYIVKRIDDYSRLSSLIAKRIAGGEIIGWAQGRSEIGPRALGNRSILADPRHQVTRERLNKIKKREWFMPIAPSVIEEDLTEFFNTSIPSPYMLRAIPVKPKSIYKIPAVIHYDFSARIQSVSKKQNPLFYNLLQSFKKETNGIPVLANTSFNGPGEPIVEGAEDAIKSFMTLGLSALVIGNWIFEPVLPQLIDQHQVPTEVE